jgi:DNA processing protein
LALYILNNTSERFNAYFAEKGFVIVSGFARGVDTEAHLGALDNSGKTIAVLPSGVLDIYPKENLKLAEDIIINGALISEISSLERINKTRFIDRNRITSGISKCVVVIESNEDGGTLQQVNIARNQGRRVFVLQPRDTDPDAIRGFNKIISLGGEPFATPDEILKMLIQNTESSTKTFHQNLSLFL